MGSRKEFILIYIKLLIADKVVGPDFKPCCSFRTCRGVPDKTQTLKIQKSKKKNPSIKKTQHNLISLE